MRPSEHPYMFPDVSTCKKVMVLGLGGGCDVLSASVLSQTPTFFHFYGDCEIVCADTKEESPGCTDLLPTVQCGEKEFKFLRSLPNEEQVRFSDVPAEYKYFGLAMTQPKGPLKSPWIVVLPEKDPQLLCDELRHCDFDLIIGVDAGGDSIVDDASSGVEGRDKRIVQALKLAQIPFIHIVLGFGCDGESTEESISKALKEEEDKGNFKGCFNLSPMLEAYRARAKGLAHSRTPNIICNAIEEKKIDRRKGDKIVIPRGRKPTIPLEWIRSGFVFVYK